MVLKHAGQYSEEQFDDLQKEYQKELGLTWDVMLGFNNTYGIAIKKDIAEENNIKTYSDLQKLNGKLILGAEYDFFERQDGFDMLCKTYDLKFASTSDMDMGLKYQAINSGKIDIMPVNTTDGQLAQADVVLLEDDKAMYPSYQAGMVVREDVLKEYPQIHEALQKFDRLISESDIQRMNYEVETEKKEPKNVAKEFLSEKGLLE